MIALSADPKTAREELHQYAEDRCNEAVQRNRWDVYDRWVEAFRATQPKRETKINRIDSRIGLDVHAKSD